MRKKTHEEFIEELTLKNGHYKEGKFKVIGDYTGIGGYIEIESEFGEALVRVDCLLAGALPRINSYLDPADFWRRRAISEREDSSMIDYSMANYTNNKVKIKLRCLKHNYSYSQRPSHHMSGVQGCVHCVGKVIKYTRENIESHQEFFDGLEGYLYVVRLFNRRESFFKVGITAKGRFKYRMTQLRKSFNLERVYEEEGLIKDLFETEQKFLSQMSHLKYTPENKFVGYTECLSDNPLEVYYHGWSNGTYN